MSEDVVARRVVVHGRVQGVFFRDSCRREAERHRVAGWVRNEPDGTVGALFEGAPDAVDRLVAWCRQGPPHARVDRVDVSPAHPAAGPPSTYSAEPMALAVCLLFDAPSQQALRRLWQRLEDDGVPTLLSHTHGRHVPHLSYAVLRTFDVDKVAEALALLPDEGPMPLHFDAMGMFRRSRTWLVPAVTSDIARRQERVVEAVESTGADLHLHYRPGVWVPHCTLAPRTTLERLPTVAAAVFDVLPLVATADRAALIDTSTGRRVRLANLP